MLFNTIYFIVYYTLLVLNVEYNNNDIFIILLLLFIINKMITQIYITTIIIFVVINNRSMSWAAVVHLWMPEPFRSDYKQYSSFNASRPIPIYRSSPYLHSRAPKEIVNRLYYDQTYANKGKTQGKAQGNARQA